MALPPRFILPVYFLVLLLGAVVLGPLIYFGALEIKPIVFHRAMDRALMVSAVLALALFLPRLRFKALWPREQGMQLLLGLLAAAVSLQAMFGTYLALTGFTSAHLSVGQAWARVTLALCAALFVSPMEETVFRGFLQRELVGSLGWKPGWILAATIYALVHFLKIPVELDKEPVHIWSGVTALGSAFAGFGHNLSRPDNLGKVINLLLVGLILGGTFVRCGSLWFNAGLHGGWIFGLLVFTGFTRPFDPPNAPWAGTEILSSPGTTLVVILTGLWLWRYYRHPSISSEAGPTAP